MAWFFGTFGGDHEAKNDLGENVGWMGRWGKKEGCGVGQACVEERTGFGSCSQGTKLGGGVVRGKGGRWWIVKERGSLGRVHSLRCRNILRGGVKFKNFLLEKMSTRS